MYLVGFRNRLSVLLQWAWAYVTYQPGVRLIASRTRARDEGVTPRAASLDIESRV